jgi:hypothetical protein
MAFEPPPMQATSVSGSRPSAAWICWRASRPMIDWKSRTMRRIGMRARHRADDVVGVVDMRDPVAQRLVHRVLERARAAVTGTTSAPSRLHAEDVGLLPLDVDLRPYRPTQGRSKRAPPWRWRRRAGPAPVSAMMRVLPMRRASRIWPMQLLILCEPVWLSSSRFR